MKCHPGNPKLPCPDFFNNANISPIIASMRTPKPISALDSKERRRVKLIWVAEYFRWREYGKINRQRLQRGDRPSFISHLGLNEFFCLQRILLSFGKWKSMRRRYLSKTQLNANKKAVPYLNGRLTKVYISISDEERCKEK
jgi:hypothetical protein